jgi:hypothetical protein
MALHVTGQAPSLCIRRQAYEQSGLVRMALDSRLGLTQDDFRVERDLIMLGPIHAISLDDLFAELDATGLRYHDDYFELSGNWPDWLQVFAASP